MGHEQPSAGTERKGQRGAPRVRDVRSALVRFAGRECLAKTVDLCEAGAGLLVLGSAPEVGEAVEISLVAGYSVALFRGTVRHVRRQPPWARLGVRFADAPPPLGAGGPIDTRGGARVPRPRCPAPVRCNLGVHFPLVSPDDRRRLLRDRRAVAAALASAGVPVDRDWTGALRRFLEAHPGSPHRAAAERELFRAVMLNRYPHLPGTVVEGAVATRPPSAPGTGSGPFVILLDRFAVARTDPDGHFVAEGIPPVDHPVTLLLGLRDAPGTSERTVSLRVPPGAPGRFRVELPAPSARPPPRADDPFFPALDELLTF